METTNEEVFFEKTLPGLGEFAANLNTSPSELRSIVTGFILTTKARRDLFDLVHVPSLDSPLPQIVEREYQKDPTIDRSYLEIRWLGLRQGVSEEDFKKAYDNYNNLLGNTRRRSENVARNVLQQIVDLPQDPSKVNFTNLQKRTREVVEHKKPDRENSQYGNAIQTNNELEEVLKEYKMDFLDLRFVMNCIDIVGIRGDIFELNEFLDNKVVLTMDDVRRIKNNIEDSINRLHSFVGMVITKAGGSDDAFSEIGRFYNLK